MTIGTRLAWVTTLFFLLWVAFEGLQEKNGGCTDPNGRPILCAGIAPVGPLDDNGGCTDPNGRPRPCQ
jgi:hypothetical protein